MRSFRDRLCVSKRAIEYRALLKFRTKRTIRTQGDRPISEEMLEMPGVW